MRTTWQPHVPLALVDGYMKRADRDGNVRGRRIKRRRQPGHERSHGIAVMVDRTGKKMRAPFTARN